MYTITQARLRGIVLIHLFIHHNRNIIKTTGEFDIRHSSK